MKQSNLLHTGFIPLGLATSAALALAGTLPTIAAHANTHPGTYTWSAELVAVDDGAQTVTAQAPLVTEADRTELASLANGTRATLVWSGINAAAGIRKVTRAAATDADALVLPIEFVSTEVNGRYVRFKVAVPNAELANIRAVQPGAWITATSPRRPEAPTEAVAAVRPYNDAR